MQCLAPHFSIHKKAQLLSKSRAFCRDEGYLKFGGLCRYSFDCIFGMAVGVGGVFGGFGGMLFGFVPMAGFYTFGGFGVVFGGLG